ncbi:MAG: Na(+)-translocating NADH-quinone reductase subunit C [Candidatus Arsenophonus melophagi]|nr:Na(+)-translocating NADH-quinone reductase subunit C [Candidatus Arsenophonus melophagi]
MDNDKLEQKTDSVGRTFLVVFILCLICATVVSGAAVGLKSKQQTQKLLDKQRNILDVAGLLKQKMSDKEIQSLYNSRVRAKILDFKTTKLSNSNGKFNLNNQLRNEETRMILSPTQDIAKIHYRANLAEIYFVNDNHGKINTLILPIYGSGLWSVMYAFIAVDIDGITLKGITYYSHGETPGLGGEVDNPQWRAQWIGKKLYNQHGEPGIKIVRAGARTNPFNIDGLSGATLTSSGIQKMFDFWLGKNGFGPFMDKVRKGELNYG